MADDDLYGVWGDRAPGGWCWISSPELPVHREHTFYSGTRQQAENTRLVLQTENPDMPYEVVPFDADREPAARVKGVSRVQIELLAAIDKDPRGHHHYGFIRSTFNALYERGLVVCDLTLCARARLTRAGREVLVKWVRRGGVEPPTRRS